LVLEALMLELRDGHQVFQSTLWLVYVLDLPLILASAWKSWWWPL